MTAPLLRTCILLTAALLVVLSTSQAGSEEFHFDVIDVGQGDALLLHEPGSCAALIDAGPPGQGSRLTAHLAGLGIDRLDLAIITHPHPDHIGGLAELARHLPIGALFDNGADNPASDSFAAYRALRTRLPYRPLAAGESIACGASIITVLYRQTSAPADPDLNAASSVLLISAPGFRLMHMGDLTGAAEERFLETKTDLAATAIKLAHHGAADATSARLLDRVAPELALISSGAGNRIGAPAEAVLDRLTQRGISVYRTDREGTIRLSLTEQGYRITRPATAAAR